MPHEAAPPSPRDPSPAPIRSYGGAGDGGREVGRAQSGAVSAVFIGRGEPAAAETLVARLARPGTRLAHARQIHSRIVLDARPGRCGEGDALVSDEPDLALCVVTADCVPLLLSDGRRIAAVHAGWRGIVAGIVGEVAARFARPSAVSAWIGPAIGPCCYEVGGDVGRAIAEAADTELVRRDAGGRLVADLPGAVHHQLAATGVDAVRIWRLCTRCDGGWSSYRRDGAGAGRNHALIWKAGD